jgi:polyferredoxin
MDKQTLADETRSPPTRPARHWALKIFFWTIIGAVLGALRAAFHSETEGWLGPVVVLAVSFGLIGAVLSLLTALGCKT